MRLPTNGQNHQIWPVSMSQIYVEKKENQQTVTMIYSEIIKFVIDLK